MENRCEEWHPRNARNEQPEGPAYTLTVYVAAPGTPIVQDSGEIVRSLPGHMYYSISDGRTDLGYGFAPRQPEMVGPGHVVTNDHRAYQNPIYARTMEITKAQYEKLNRLLKNTP